MIELGYERRGMETELANALLRMKEISYDCLVSASSLQAPQASQVLAQACATKHQAGKRTKTKLTRLLEPLEIKPEEPMQKLSRNTVNSRGSKQARQRSRHTRYGTLTGCNTAEMSRWATGSVLQVIVQVSKPRWG